MSDLLHGSFFIYNGITLHTYISHCHIHTKTLIYIHILCFLAHTVIHLYTLIHICSDSNSYIYIYSQILAHLVTHIHTSIHAHMLKHLYSHVFTHKSGTCAQLSEHIAACEGYFLAVHFCATYVMELSADQTLRNFRKKGPVLCQAPYLLHLLGTVFSGSSPSLPTLWNLRKTLAESSWSRGQTYQKWPHGLRFQPRVRHVV